MQDGFSDMEQSSEKTSELCSQVDCRSGQDGVKGQDERQRTAPLTPPRPLKENPCQKSLDWSRRCHTRKLHVPFNKQHHRYVFQETAKPCLFKTGRRGIRERGLKLGMRVRACYADRRFETGFAFVFSATAGLAAAADFTLFTGFFAARASSPMLLRRASIRLTTLLGRRCGASSIGIGRLLIFASTSALTATS